MASKSTTGKPYVRLATPKDFDKVVKVSSKAFLHDPVINYFGDIPKLLEENADIKECENRRLFFSFLTKACFLVGGRITVVMDPAKNESESSTEDKIVAGALWMPPKKHLAFWMILTMLRAGVIPVLARWGLTGVLRIVRDYQETSEKKSEECFKGMKGDHGNSWYLLQVFTDPDHQGKGLMSMLVREAFEHAPEHIFTLEATTAKSRDQYTRLGFENPISVKFGQGKADANGLRASGTDAVGVEIWAMAKWPSN